MSKFTGDKVTMAFAIQFVHGGKCVFVAGTLNCLRQLIAVSYLFVQLLP